MFMRCWLGVRKGLLCLEKILGYISQRLHQHSRRKRQTVLTEPDINPSSDCQEKVKNGLIK